MNAQEWPRSRLDELTHEDRQITYGVVKPGDHDADGVRFIRGGDVFDGRINIAALRTITPEISQQYKRTLLRGGELLVSLVGNPGEVAIAPASLKGANIARQVGLVALKSSVHAPYVMYFLISDYGRRELFAQTTGSVQKVINLANLKDVRVPLPQLTTQRKIASILSAYDDLIENNTRRIAILEAVAQAIYREWFVEFRFPGHEQVKLVDSPLGIIPEGWVVSPLKQITTKIGSGATPRGGKEAYKSSGITLIRSLNIYDYQFEHDGLAYIDDEQAAQLDNVVVEKRDILLNITGASVARCCMVPSYLLPARVNQHVAIIRVDADKCDPFYVLNTINNERHKRQILALAQGGATREALTKDTISNYEIALPPLRIVKAYSEVVTDLFDQRELLQRKNNCLRKTRNLLLSKLISGQLDVENLDIETGEAVTE